MIGKQNRSKYMWVVDVCVLSYNIILLHKIYIIIYFLKGINDYKK